MVFLAALILTAQDESATESAATELELLSIECLQAMTAHAPDSVMRLYADDFKGTPLFAPLPPDAQRTRLERIGVEIATAAGGAETDRAGARQVLVDFTGGLRAITWFFLKFPKLEVRGDEARGLMNVNLDGETNDGKPIEVSDQFEATFVKGRLKTARRVSARWVTAERRLFTDVTDAVGLAAPREITKFMAVEPFTYMGGMAVGDFDGDGFDDVFFACLGEDRLFRNDRGAKFVDVTAQAGLRDTGCGAGALFFDHDNDGDLDLLVANHAPDPPAPGLPLENALVLWRNDGGQFTDVTERAGLMTKGPATSLCAADVDKDGDLDVYVGMYADWKEQPPLARPVLNAKNGVANQLWINNGGTFTQEAARRGVADTGWTLACGFADYDDDGDPDLYVVNDFGPNTLYRNRGDGTFEDVTQVSGTADVGFGMGLTWADVDGDGRLDLYVSNMYSSAGNRVISASALKPEDEKLLRKAARGNTLLRNRGDGTFEDITETAGVARANWAWGNVVEDIDGDLRPDILVVNGYISGESPRDL